MKGVYRFTSLLVFFAMSSSAADAQLMSVELGSERSFGYLIGDEIRLYADIALEKSYTLVSASIPRPGPITYWLDLKAVDVQRLRAGQYRLNLTYQTFYAPLGLRTLEIPGFTLTATNGASRVEARIPAWRFSSSPLRDVGPNQPGAAVAIHKDAPPLQVSRRPYDVAAGGFAVVTLIFALLSARHWARWPFNRRPQRPFSNAARGIRHGRGDLERPEQYLGGLLRLHRAFDVSAGRCLLADDVAAFLQESPQFSARREDIEAFFRASHLAFFRADPLDAMTRFSPARLIALCSGLAAAEREAM